jgi:hypothetical protein
MIGSGMLGDVSGRDLARSHDTHPGNLSLSEREKEINEQGALDAQFAALFTQGFFSPVSSLGSDPDGAGGALTLGPATAQAAALMFKLEVDPNTVSV